MAVDAEYSDSDDKRCRSWLAWNILAVSTLLAAWVLANLVPFLGDLVDLLGASFTPLSCWVMPIAMFGRWYWNAGDDRPHVSKVEWTVMLLELLLAFVLMFLGTWSAVMNIVKEWHTYGYPFECHCEGLWDTCACSADHAGMSEVCNMLAGH